MNSSVVYKDYSDSDVDAVVQMWKESRPGWPPGFFGASEISASSVANEEKSSGRLFTVLAFLENRVVGYCRTSPYGGEIDASYVDLLNVVPDIHGMGIGKALLLDAVNRSFQCGMNRIDLHTWSANMKAVPLYKKTGFFWVPETVVYMQNYIPYLLGRDEFVKFLHGEDWYKCFERTLLVEPDVEKTEYGREIFQYVFKRGENSFIAEFDKKGRCLSAIEYPGFSAALRLKSSNKEFFVGRSYPLILTGSEIDETLVSVDSGKSLTNSSINENSFHVEPESVRITKSVYEPADCVTVSLPENNLKLGIGVVGVEEVCLSSNVLYFLSPNTKELKLGLKKLADISSVVVSYAVNQGEFYSRVLPLNSDIYQSCFIELPVMETGLHTISIRFGENGYLETLIVVCGVYCGEPALFDTRKAAIIVGNDWALSVARKGAAGNIWGRGSGETPVHLGGFFVGAGPPSVWNSDLPKQVYALELKDGVVTARTSWPSRPGLTHWISARLDPTGYIETLGGINNDSDTSQKVLFGVRQYAGKAFDQRDILIPLAGGLFKEPKISNQLPVAEEDLTGSISSLGAPWTGVSGGEKAMMSYFSQWTELQFGNPIVPEVDVIAGESIVSPPFRMLVVDGDEKALFSKAKSLGWDVGNWRERIPFIKHNLKPVMCSQSTVTLSHPLQGERDGRISACDEDLCTGKIKSGIDVPGTLVGDGFVDVTLSIAERDTVLPVYLVNSAAEVKSSKGENGHLILSTNRIEIKIDPKTFGHVYSVKLDSVEYAFASNPEPSTFAWEKPWYGGILPRIQDRGGNQYSMKNKNPEVTDFEEIVNGLTETGWQISWKINHKMYGSLNVKWKVALVPGVPVLKTSLLCESSSGEYLDSELDIRGFVQPGGSVKDSILTCESYPGLVQGRKHAGTWALMGKWARVERQNSFVEVYSIGDGEFFCEDYAENGCFFSVNSGGEKKKNLNVTWLFGDAEEDEVLASVFRAHR